MTTTFVWALIFLIETIMWVAPKAPARFFNSRRHLSIFIAGVLEKTPERQTSDLRNLYSDSFSIFFNITISFPESLKSSETPAHEAIVKAIKQYAKNLGI